MGKILVTGGMGYIGSHTIVSLIEAGYDVLSVDNLDNSEREVGDWIESITDVRVVNYEIDLRNARVLSELFREHSDIMGVIHFAAHKAVGESVEKPLKYYDNNLSGLINVLRCCRDSDVKSFIYSSSCTVYGIPDKMPVDEQTPLQEAESPYGQTKRMGEQIIQDFLKVENSIRGISLRYFNPAGAHMSAKMGESARNTAVNLVPVITETAYGLRDEVVVFGDHYDTRDGTCVRDYIHIMDLADAHVMALKLALSDKKLGSPEYINLGIGEGVTVLEAINAFEKVSGQKLNYRIGPPRPGDVPAIYADPSKALEVLDWRPKYTIDDIMRSAWLWEQSRRG